MSNSELAVSYAALILADDNVEITSDKLQAVIKAAGNTEVEPIWCSLFAKALEGKDVKDLLLNVGSGGGAAAAPGGGGAAASGGAGAAEEKEPEKEEGALLSYNPPSCVRILTTYVKQTEKEEESDEDMGFGLFD
ncbi:ribosomal protein 60S [Choiromyces venosus 120613-1]|uniref:Large ribosomal subunit protein P1 n=1 Tax=Choiromyces venosus 120613-1 TaxID=1336337 RepID=A0A3N4JY41_9PEZI|nr:ribosomal protein 60S [Choiromyces venosus 120613-1]